MSYPVIIYMNSSGDDYLDKVLSGGTTINCDFKQPIDIENPTIYISATDAYDKYNYCYIAEFGRYYWMKPVGGNGQTITYSCESDPLMSFKAQIRACPCVVARNPWHFDLYLPDNKLPIETRTATATIKFPNDPFSGDHNCYILTTLGSGESVNVSP